MMACEQRTITLSQLSICLVRKPQHPTSDELISPINCQKQIERKSSKKSPMYIIHHTLYPLTPLLFHWSNYNCNILECDQIFISGLGVKRTLYVELTPPP